MSDVLIKKIDNTWLSIKGPKGDTGDPGPTGPAGAGVAGGVVLVDFGTFPGATEKQVTVSDAGVTAGSRIQAWPDTVATADHTADEVYLEEFNVQAFGPGAGTFLLLARPRVGLSFGRYQFNYTYA